ncbi:telomere-binding alpha subunit central domain protein [Aspergillus clavatus NRRL 1]|uniref:Protection of telomeres protein 1 n=1 Tax=Aspergillus clavatus (strain ATCC 1007 / CBS 513.65 / DSM 816 / NCTC 3887 / NRRL 1 / QM 1276 / 107) TaxID=344612 RepID=A1C7U8_ASPCL|nr:telomere-binding protein alpha subunit, central domain, putative [Aspergillus clavatus NRRL 1]EAW14469.1 telomere-binding protein alpha subunit, central domain, putative [Aspergillus clavatus NRRL 1]
MSNKSVTGFVDIPTALASSGVVSVVIGVVVDVFGDVFQSSRSSCITFTIKDSNFGNGHVWDGLKVKYFKENANLLPPVQVHDVILLRNISIRRFNGRPLGVAPDGINIPWAIFRPDSNASVSSLSPISGPIPFEPSRSESTYALSLIEKSSGFRTFRKASSQRAAPTSTRSVPSLGPTSRSTGNQKFALIQNVEERTFVDLIGEIIKIHYNESEKVALYLTDYTANQELYNYVVDGVDAREGDEYGYQPRSLKNWPGPAGRMTLQITLWEPHASFAREHFRAGDIVRLRNVHIKRSRIEGSLLEASLHGDRQNPQEVNIRKYDANQDERGQALLLRRNEYWASDPRKRSANEAKEPSSSRKRTKKNQQKKVESKQAKKEEGQVTLSISRKYKLNDTVKAAHPSINTSRIEDILDSDFHNNVSPDRIEYRFPFQNVCYRSTVRVVDFFPPLLEDFAVPDLSESRRQTSPSRESGRPTDPDRFIPWVWRFCLLVENVPPPRGQPKERMKLFVSGADAEYLLKIDATNLRKDRSRLGQLREKLFHVWGDLEERKVEAATKGTTLAQDPRPISSVPFACCIKEYGVKCSHDGPFQADNLLGCALETCFGWERRFAMFMTTIQA